MNDISQLKQRIEQAATGLDEAENMRRDRNSTLGDTLAKVEGRFNARLLELGYLRERIGELESANQGLTETIDTFSAMIQDESEGEIESALFRASAGARELLAQIDSGALSPRQPPLAAFDRHLEQPMRFEDVTEAELQAEQQMFENVTAAELEAEDLGGFPALSTDAPTAADDGIDIPEVTEDLDVPDPATGTIHELLERLARRTAAA
jgi:hypothetical protein